MWRGTAAAIPVLAVVACSLVGRSTDVLTSGGSCTAPRVACGNLCVDPSENSSNCGGCGISCKSAEVCLSGRCGPACGGGQIACDSACASTTNDPRHCGTCANACKAGEVCGDARCSSACPTGQTN